MMNEDIMTMSRCYLTCTKTLKHCLEKGGDHAAPQLINLLEDCAKICNMASDFASRGSDNHRQICAACARICRDCAAACQGLADDDEVMQDCADMCRKCADTCERMSGNA